MLSDHRRVETTMLVELCWGFGTTKLASRAPGFRGSSAKTFCQFALVETARGFGAEGHAGLARHVREVRDGEPLGCFGDKGEEPRASG